MKLKTFLAAGFLLSVLAFKQQKFEKEAAQVSGAAGAVIKYTIPSDIQTSAGIYDQKGVLVRILWNNEFRRAGQYSYTWNGETDDGLLAKSGKYTLQLMRSPVTAKWLGIFGNSSEAQTGPGVVRQFSPFQGIAATHDRLYWVAGYSEGNTSAGSFPLNNIRRKNLDEFKYKQTATHVCTDGQLVFYGGTDVTSNRIKKKSSFIVAANNGGDLHNFETGKSYKPVSWGAKMENVVDVVFHDSAMITGLAVQRDGNLLFVARAKMDTIHVLDKRTGKFLGSVYSKNCGSLACFNDKLYVAARNKVVIYKITKNGTVEAGSNSLEGFDDVKAMAVSNDGKIISIIDAGKSQQVRSFSTSSLKEAWTLGTKGGNLVTAVVSDNCFYFISNCGITYEDDGSFWVTDNGNNRVQHYTADRKFINRFEYQPRNYYVTVVEGDSSRVFSNYLEYHVDYTKPVGAGKNFGTLVKNYSAFIPDDYKNSYNGLGNVVKLSNERTYGMVISRKKPIIQIIELTNEGVKMRNEITVDKAKRNAYGLYADGSLRENSTFRVGTSMEWRRRDLKGFTNAGDLIWGQEYVYEKSPPRQPSDPGAGLLRNKQTTLADGTLIAYDGQTQNQNGRQYKLGALRNGKWLWRTYPVTFTGYYGAFPHDAFDIGNSVVYGGDTKHQVFDDFILVGYHGEFWKNAQTNKYNLFYRNGLLITQFGTAGKTDSIAPAGRAGNAFSGGISKVGSDYYYFHGDEFSHSGIHVWKIEHAHDIKIDKIGFTFERTSGVFQELYADQELSRLRSAGVAKSMTSGRPTRMQFFAQAKYNEPYTFSVATSGKYKLWVNDTVVAQDWDSLVSSIPVTLYTEEANKFYIETTSPFSLQWQSPHQQKQNLPEDLCFAKVVPVNYTEDILAHLMPQAANVDNNKYGFQRYPVNNITDDRLRNWWQVTSGVKTYNLQQSTDLYIRYVQKQRANYYVERELQPLKRDWKISFDLSFDGGSPNSGDGPQVGSAQYMDFLDNSNKIILRLYSWKDPDTKREFFKINDASFSAEENPNILAVLDKYVHFTLSCEKEKLYFKTGENSIDLQPYDRQAMPTPVKVKWTFFTNNRNEAKVLDIKNFMAE